MFCVHKYQPNTDHQKEHGTTNFVTGTNAAWTNVPWTNVAWANVTGALPSLVGVKFELI